jgi:hypothetical protein
MQPGQALSGTVLPNRAVSSSSNALALGIRRHRVGPANVTQTLVVPMPMR